jgi:hypothetical protein
MTGPDEEPAEPPSGPSPDDLDYRIRPGKSIVRKMVVETLRKLSGFAQLENFRYIGLGGLYFADFVAVHKALGINGMISIERNSAERERYELNQPYSCIRVFPGYSHDVLPTLRPEEWEHPVILWLDYDGVLDSDKLTDIETFCRSAATGSVIIATVNVRPPPLREDGGRLAALRKRVGRERIPARYTDATLGDWGTANAMRDVMLSSIDDILAHLNGSRNANDSLEFRQLFDFRYRDGAHMLTFGGILFQHRDRDRVRDCAFEELEFLTDRGGVPESVSTPALTFRETRNLDKSLPEGDEAKWDPAIPRDDARAYKKLYRYFPSFVEAEL